MVHPLDTVQNDVVVLGGLKRAAHAGQLPQLPPPHACAVDHVLRLNAPLVGHNTRHRPAGLFYPNHLHPFHDAYSTGGRTLREGDGDIHRVGPAVGGGQEAGQNVVHPRLGPQGGHLPGRYFVILDAHHPSEGRFAAQVFENLLGRCHLKQADRIEARGKAGVLLQPCIKIPCVAGDLHPGGGREPRGGDEPGRVPGSPRGQFVTLDEQHVAPSPKRKVVGNAAANDASTDDDYASRRGQFKIGAYCGICH